MNEGKYSGVEERAIHTSLNHSKRLQVKIEFNRIEIN